MIEGITQTVTGVYYFNVRTAKRSYYRGGFKSFEEAYDTKQIYDWARISLKLRRQLKGKRVWQTSKVSAEDLKEFDR